MIGVSSEVVEHHLKLHREECDGEIETSDCPCGRSQVQFCGRCRVLLSMRMESTELEPDPCEHAQLVMERYERNIGGAG